MPTIWAFFSLWTHFHPQCTGILSADCNPLERLGAGGGGANLLPVVDAVRTVAAKTDILSGTQLCGPPLWCFTRENSLWLQGPDQRQKRCGYHLCVRPERQFHYCEGHCEVSLHSEVSTTKERTFIGGRSQKSKV